MSKRPKMRFKGYNEAWRERKLSDIATMHARIGWQNLRTSEFLDSGEYLLITGTDFENGAINYGTCHFVARERYEQDKRIQVHNGSILITKDGTLGKVAFVQELAIPATLNAGVFHIDIKDADEVDNRYLFQYIKAPFLMDYVDKRATGGTIKHLNQNILVDFPVVAPRKSEQEKIGAYFLALDSLITLQQRKYDKLLTYKKAMLEKMFPKDGADVPEVRFAGFSGVWNKCNIKDICSISTGKSNTQDSVEDGIYPFYVRSPIIECSNRYLFDEEAVLTVGDGVGTGNVFHYVNGKYDLHQRVYRMYDFSCYIAAKYFYYYFAKHFYKRVMMMTAKTSVDSVRYEMIADMDFSFPSKSEQQAIANFFDELEQLSALQRSKIDALRKLKSALLNKMFI